MGKTVVACQTALYAAKNGNPTLFLSLEMGEAEIMRRFIAMVGLLGGVIFFLVTLAQGIATVYLDPCQL